MLEKKLVIFDFCETLVSFQSADRFIDRIAIRHFPKRHNRINNLIHLLRNLHVLTLTNIIFPKLNLNKRLVLLKIRGLKLEVLNDEALKYLEDEIIPSLNMDLMNRLIFHQKNNDHIIIISGGYDPYLKLFCKKFHIPNFFSTRIAIKNGVVSGFMEGKDCMYNQKVELIIKWMEKTGVTKIKKVCYTDSSTDMPILNWADEAFVVSYNTSQKWVAKNNFQEIIIIK